MICWIIDTWRDHKRRKADRITEELIKDYENAKTAWQNAQYRYSLVKREIHPSLQDSMLRVISDKHGEVILAKHRLDAHWDKVA